MPFRRTRGPGGIIQRVKHVVDSEGGLVAVTDSINQLAITVNQRATTFSPTEVLLGSTVNGFFISLFVIGASGAGLPGAQNWYIAKRRSGQAFTDFPNPGNTGTSQVRNQIFHEEKGLAGSADGTPMAFKGVIAVPKGMRRMREGDEFFINIRNNSSTEGANFCLKAIYNEFN